jgi:hypothetical protein
VHTHLQFRNTALVDPAVDDSQPSGRKLAALIEQALPAHGFAVRDAVEEDWGWAVLIENPDFPLWAGCGHAHEFENGHLCFIEPRKPRIRRWFRRIDTTATVSRLALALEAIVRSHPDTSDVRWWSEEEVLRG